MTATGSSADGAEDELGRSGRPRSTGGNPVFRTVGDHHGMGASTRFREVSEAGTEDDPDDLVVQGSVALRTCDYCGFVLSRRCPDVNLHSTCEGVPPPPY